MIILQHGKDYTKLVFGGDDMYENRNYAAVFISLYRILAIN